MKTHPHKSQPVLYRAYGGDEYAALITDVRENNECALVTFLPGGGTTTLTRVKYFSGKQDCVSANHNGPACYPAI